MIYIYIGMIYFQLYYIRILLFIILCMMYILYIYKLYNVGWFLGTPKPEETLKGTMANWCHKLPLCSFMAAIKNNLILSLLYLNTIRLEAASNQSAQSPKRPWTMSKSKRSLQNGIQIKTLVSHVFTFLFWLIETIIEHLIPMGFHGFNNDTVYSICLESRNHCDARLASGSWMKMAQSRWFYRILPFKHERIFQFYFKSP